MDFKRALMNRALRLMQDPRVQKMAQNPKLWHGVAGAWELKARVERELDAAARRLAHELDLATPGEVREMRETIERLERELERNLERAREARPARAPSAPSRPPPEPGGGGAESAATGRSPRRRVRKAPGPGSAPPPP
jgi:hypothetical protein